MQKEQNKISWSSQLVFAAVNNFHIWIQIFENMWSYLVANEIKTLQISWIMTSKKMK